MSITDPLARLEILIAQAEAKFGPREPVALTAVGFARVSNPITLFSKQEHGAVILMVAVGEALLTDEPTLQYQLAHEAVHCLAHNFKITRLEEGVATLFGLDHAPAGEEDRLDFVRKQYLADVRCLLKASPDAIRVLRGKSPKFQDIEPADIEALGAAPDLANRLCAPG
jgi:hypothetical protein